MSVQRKITSIAEAARKKEEMEAALQSAAKIKEVVAQVTDTQLALCEVFELIMATTGGE